MGFCQRFGFLPSELVTKLSQGENIWLHAVSVGEVAAMEGVIDALRRKYPERRIVLTVTTKAGYSFAQRKCQGLAEVVWSPLDLSPTVDRFVQVIRPVIYIAAETELWPNLFARLSRDKTPIIVLNGRISDISFPRYSVVKGVLKGTLRRVAYFGMQSALDAERIIELGALKDTVRVLGNVKFDSIIDAGSADLRGEGLAREHLLLVAGSTHPGEEEVMLDIFQSLKRSSPLIRLVLAPRHPERSAQVGELVRQAGLRPVFFSRNGRVTVQDDVMIVDTIGYLLQFYSAASVVFVGKSLTVHGGHNIIEPAMFAKPIVVGPHMQNFKDIVQAFLMEHAVIQVEDALGLKTAIQQLLQNEPLRKDLGDKARMVVRRNRGAVERAVGMIEAVLKDK